MNLSFAYSPLVWPMLSSAALMVALGVYAWKRRAMPGAIGFVFLMLFRALWAISAAFSVLAADETMRSFWFRFEALWYLPTTTAGLWLAMELANLRHWLTRRHLLLFGLVPVLTALLMITNEFHRLIWVDPTPIDPSQGETGIIGILLLGYGALLILANWYILFWLLTQSPLYQWALGVLLLAQMMGVALYYLDRGGLNPFAPMDASTLVFNIGGILYLLAIFRLGLFSILPVARETVISQMQEAMVVLDRAEHIVDLNRAAERILGIRSGQLRRAPLSATLNAQLEIKSLVNKSVSQSEITIRTTDGVRNYAAQLSPLADRRGTLLGHVILLHDITEQKRTQQQVLVQQRALGILEERERLARELHDSLGQVLGYVSMQAQAIEKQIRDGKTATVAAQITRLSDVAREAHADLRESILNLRTGVTQERSLVQTMRQYLASFQANYGIQTELVVPAELENEVEAEAAVQLLRVIQEAFSNARRHGQARHVRVELERQPDHMLTITIADDGCGFQPDRAVQEGHLGLAMMRERMAGIGGFVTIESHPGAGARVVLSLPAQRAAARQDKS